MTNVLLVEAHERVGGATEFRYPPLQFGYLAAYASRLGSFSFHTITCGSGISRTLDSVKPDLVGIATISQNFGTAKRIAAEIKAYGDIPVIMGGHHISALPELLDESMDVAVLGEGEVTFAELLQVFQAGKFKELDRLRRVSGIAFHDGCGICCTEPRPAVEVLDDLPLPNRRLLTINPRDAHMFSSRGCPFRCEFCSSAHFWKRPRYHTAGRVAREILELVEVYGVRSINLFDDLFASHPSRLGEICELLEPAWDRLGFRPGFACLARADVLTPPIASLLKRLGVTGVALGFESGSTRVVKYLKGASASVEENLRAAEVLRQVGISVVGSVIVGTPGETAAEAEETLAMLNRLRLDAGEAYLAVPFPGTGFWQQAEKLKLVGPAMEWDRLQLDFFRGIDYPVVINQTMSRQEIYDYWQKANRIINPQWVDLNRDRLKRS